MNRFVKYLLLLCTLSSLVNCSSRKQLAYTFKIGDVQETSFTEETEVDDSLVTVRIHYFKTDVPFKNDTIEVPMPNPYVFNLDSLLPLISEQYEWILSNEKKILRKFENSFNYKGQIKGLNFEDIDGCFLLLTSEKDTTLLKRELFIAREKRFLSGTRYVIKVLQ